MSSGRQELRNALVTSVTAMAELDTICNTELEKSFVIELISELYAEPHFSDVGVNEIAMHMDVQTSTAKGVLGSLVKKGICDVPDDNYFAGIVYLNPKYYYLHPIQEWRDAGY